MFVHPNTQLAVFAAERALAHRRAERLGPAFAELPRTTRSAAVRPAVAALLCRVAAVLRAASTLQPNAG